MKNTGRRDVGRWREWTRSLGMLLAALLAAGLRPAASWADSNPGDDSDSLTITVTPDLNYSVNLTTTDAHMGLGTVALGQSTFTVRPSTVDFGGTVLTGHELDLSASINSAGTAWGFDSTPSTAATPNDGASAEADKLAMYALFTSTKVAGAPSAAAFGRPDAASGNANENAAIDDEDGDSTVSGVRAGLDSGAANAVCTNKFEYCLGTSDENKNMDDNRLGVASDGDMRRGSAHLWFYLRLPGSTTSGAQQSITVTLTHALGDS